MVEAFKKVAGNPFVKAGVFFVAPVLGCLYGHAVISALGLHSISNIASAVIADPTMLIDVASNGFDGLTNIFAGESVVQLAQDTCVDGVCTHGPSEALAGYDPSLG